MVMHLPAPRCEAQAWSSSEMAFWLFERQCSLQLATQVVQQNAAIMDVRIIQLKDGELSLFSNIWSLYFSAKSSTHLVILLFRETHSKPF